MIPILALIGLFILFWILTSSGKSNNSTSKRNDFNTKSNKPITSSSEPDLLFHRSHSSDFNRSDEFVKDNFGYLFKDQNEFDEEYSEEEKTENDSGILKDESLNALVSLGFNKKRAEAAIDKVIQESKGILTSEEIIKQALKML